MEYLTLPVFTPGIALIIIPHLNDLETMRGQHFLDLIAHVEFHLLLVGAVRIGDGFDHSIPYDFNLNFYCFPIDLTFFIGNKGSFYLAWM